MPHKKPQELKEKQRKQASKHRRDEEVTYRLTSPHLASNYEEEEEEEELSEDGPNGKFLLIYICTFHVLVLSHLLLLLVLIYICSICKLHWNLNTQYDVRMSAR